MSVGKYTLIYDTGDMVFTTLKEAKKWAEYLLSKGRHVDRIQQNLGWESKKKPKILVDYYAKSRTQNTTLS